MTQARIDIIRWHSIRAIDKARLAELCSPQDSPTLLDAWARAEGASYGHAFRATELAYELGFAQSERRCTYHSGQVREFLALPVYTAVRAMWNERELRKHAAVYWLSRAAMATESLSYEAYCILRNTIDYLMLDGDPVEELLALRDKARRFARNAGRFRARSRICLGDMRIAHELDNDVYDAMVATRATSYAALVIRECMVSKEQPT